MALRLFSVGDTYFSNKMDAKAARGAKGKVSKGPDHMGNHGHSVPATRHRGPQQGFARKER